MRIEIRARHLDFAKSLRAHVEHRLKFALGRFAPRIDRVTVWLEDINGTRGGVDKQCRIHVTLARSGELRVHDTDADLRVAIDRAAERMGHAVGKSFDRRRDVVHA